MSVIWDPPRAPFPDEAMKRYTRKVFRHQGDLAIRLPKVIAFPADMDVTIERDGDVLTVRPLRPPSDPAAEKRKVAELVAALRTLPEPDEIEEREPPLPPKRVDE